MAINGYHSMAMAQDDDPKVEDGILQGPLPWPQEMLQGHQLRSHRGFQLQFFHRAQLHGKAGPSHEAPNMDTEKLGKCTFWLNSM